MTFPRWPALLLLSSLLLLTRSSPFAGSSGEGADPAAELRAGKSFIPTHIYTEEEDRNALRLFDGLRVADVSDAMDQAGLQNIGLMDFEIRPLWKDTQHFSHRFTGIAVTARYVPTNEPPAGKKGPEDFDRWVGAWYHHRSSEPFVPLLRAGSALVIEDTQQADVGSIGSN